MKIILTIIKYHKADEVQDHLTNEKYTDIFLKLNSLTRPIDDSGNLPYRFSAASNIYHVKLNIIVDIRVVCTKLDSLNFCVAFLHILNVLRISNNLKKMLVKRGLLANMNKVRPLHLEFATYIRLLPQCVDNDEMDLNENNFNILPFRSTSDNKTRNVRKVLDRIAHAENMGNLKVCFTHMNSIGGYPKEGSYEVVKLILDRNCTHIIGNLILTGINRKADGSDPDLGFLKSIQEISGYLIIMHSNVNTIPLSNLRVIRANNGGYKIHDELDFAALVIRKNYKDGGALNHVDLRSLKCSSSIKLGLYIRKVYEISVKERSSVLNEASQKQSKYNEQPRRLQDESAIRLSDNYTHFIVSLRHYETYYVNCIIRRNSSYSSDYLKNCARESMINILDTLTGFTIFSCIVGFFIAIVRGSVYIYDNPGLRYLPNSIYWTELFESVGEQKVYSHNLIRTNGYGDKNITIDLHRYEHNPYDTKPEPVSVGVRCFYDILVHIIRRLINSLRKLITDRKSENSKKLMIIGPHICELQMENLESLKTARL
ncbi:Epidermal growth factor receptor [Schistosoma japonicum]|nr:Epidermal growth factor receptor [Schistosoma japonicum]